jgi:hypothetical protein
MTGTRPQPEVPVSLFAGTDSVIDCLFVADDGRGGVHPYDLTGAAIAFYKKARVNDPDPTALYTTANGGIVVIDPVGGHAQIQVLKTHVPRRGQFRYHVDATVAGLTVVLAWGPLSVVDR